jgi:NTE family protein
MKLNEFTGHPEVIRILGNLREEELDKKQFSDVLDEHSHQYIELVQEGGGVLGVALIGYTYVLEQMGLRFFSLAGTSAGSINALLLASFGDISRAKSEKLIELLVNKNLYDFVDGDQKSRKFIEALVEKAKKATLVIRGLRVINTITQKLGLNPGNDFLNWMTGILKDNGIKTTKDLFDFFGQPPSGMKIREGIDRTLEGLKPRFAIISADLTTETKVEFPLMRPLYWKEPEDVNPALFVRASMSIPYFFEPLVIGNIPKGAEAVSLWDKLAKYRGDIPDEVHFVDGGIMSNFPIDVFHKFNTVPRMPTFGVRLGVDRNQYNRIKNPMSLFGAMFNSIRHLHDYDFILKNPDYSMLIQHIHIGDHNWLNFSLTAEDKKDLFIRGAGAAAEFLRKFDWKDYKEVRAQIKTTQK